MIRPEEHSQYIVRNADFPATQRWEQEFVAALCRHQRSSRPEAKSLPFRGDRVRARAWLKLCAMLQVVDALDTGRRAELRIERLVVQRRQVKLAFAGRRTTGLEIPALELRRAYFERVFRRHLSVEQA
jgi:exopolyphosphatase/pppGpp-phosphohydrolase